MADEQTPPPRGPRVQCQGCGGTGFVMKPQLYMPSGGEAKTVTTVTRCKYCRDDPGWQGGFFPDPRGDEHG